MSIFKKRSKAEKASKAAEKVLKKGGKHSKKAAEEQKPAQQPYMHVPQAMHQQQTAPPDQGLPCNGSGYFSQSSHLPPSFDSAMLGNPKMATAARDRGYVRPHASSDSGYGSNPHSRTPSENMNLTELSRQTHLPRDETGPFPERSLSLSEELTREPAFSEASFDDTADRPLPSPRPQPDSLLNSKQGYFSQLDPANDGRSVKPPKSLKSSLKQTRFERATDPSTTRLQQRAQPHHQLSQRVVQQQSFLAEQAQDPRPDSATLPQPSFADSERSTVSTFGQYDESRASLAAPDGSLTPPPSQHYQEPQPQFTLPMRMCTPPPPWEREQLAAPRRYSLPSSQSNFAPLKRVMSGGQESISGPIASLEGYKVNKGGNILDEEGELIGELYEGDIIDCVRQRCNAHGEVLDDRGRVVGQVRAIETVADSPMMRLVSPAPSVQRHSYQQIYQRPAQPTPISPTGRSWVRRDSEVSQPDVFTPAWQRQSHNQTSHFAQDPRDHLADSSHQCRHPVASVGFPSNATAGELLARKSAGGEREDQEAVLPTFDHSDVFMPPPFVPARSPRRSKSPSPPPEEQAPVRTSMPVPAPKPIAARQESYEGPQAQAKHTSAHPVPREYQPAPQQEVQQTEAPAPDLTPGRASSVLATATAICQLEPEPAFHEQQLAAAASAPALAPTAAPQHQTQQSATPAVQAPQPQAQPPQQQQSARRVNASPILRNANDSSMAGIAKSYARPCMSPVPEHRTSDGVEKKPTGMMFAYKGDIPAADGALNSRLAPPQANGAKSPPLPAFPTRSFTGGLPGGSPFSPLNAAAFSTAGGLNSKGQAPRQFTTSTPGLRPIMTQRNSFNAPLKRSPLSSHETTPTDTERASSNGSGKVDTVNHLAPGMQSRSASSVRTMDSMYSASQANRKSRTYFTHAGRVTVGAGEETPAQIAAKEAVTRPEKTPTPSVSGMSTKSKKIRFGFGMGKKN